MSSQSPDQQVLNEERKLSPTHMTDQASLDDDDDTNYEFLGTASLMNSNASPLRY